MKRNLNELYRGSKIASDYNLATLLTAKPNRPKQDMTLHDAIEKLLKEIGQPMTSREIAEGLNENRWYVKGNKSQIKPSQIKARVDNYHDLFEIDRSTSPLKINLRNRQIHTRNKFIPTKSLTPIQSIETSQISSVDNSLIEKELMNEKHFKNASTIDKLVPSRAGFYCIRITDINNLPRPFNTSLKDREHNIIYIGVATKSLQTRFLNQELRAKGHGTFFRSIGAVLGHLPPKGSLLTKKNKCNYKFLKTDEQEIIKWINDNLTVNWVDFSGNFENLENKLIKKYRPLINLSKNPSALKELSDLRRICVQIANEK